MKSRNLINQVILSIAVVLAIASANTAQVAPLKPQETRDDQSYFAEGDLLFGQGRYREAIEAFKQGLRIDHDIDRTRYYNKITHAYSLLKESASAIETARKTLEIQPDNTEAWARLGYEYQALGNYEESLKAYQRAVQLNPADATSFAMIGRAYSGLKQHGEAIKAFQRSVQLEPEDGDPYVGLSYAYLETGKDEEVIKAAKLAILYKSQFTPTAYNNMGYAYQRLGQYEESASALKQAVLLDPHYVKAYNNLGRTLSLLGRHDEAIEVLKRAISMRPDEITPHLNLGFTYFTLERFEEAAAELKQATVIDPKFVPAYLKLGLAYNQSARYEQAIEAFTQVLALKPQEANAFRSRSYSNLFLARGDAAAADAEKYLELSGGRNQRDQYLYLVAHFGYRQARRDDEANRILDEATKNERKAWPYSVISYLRREITAQDLLAQAIDGDMKTEAEAYIGTDLLLSDRREEAKPYLQWVKDNGNKSFVEYALAVAELQRLEKEKKLRE